MTDADTIAAIATPPGAGAVAIVRISGPRAFAIGRDIVVTRGAVRTDSARMQRAAIVDSASRELVDDALMVRFAAPHSYTGEDVVELHVHGGPGVVVGCLSLVLRHGARLAQPGEFTKRAFCNGRMDLAQAEAVADLIAAESERAAKAAAFRLAGTLGSQLRAMRAELLDRLVEIEAHVDYPDEVDAPNLRTLAHCLQSQRERVAHALAGSGAAQVLRDGIDCVIAGPPNAGKSSLLNALLDAERAIVSEIPGTTRDIVEDRACIDGVVLRLRDTAGLRSSGDRIEAEGVARARQAIGQAQLIVTVIDASRELGPDDRCALEQTQNTQRIVLANKLDLGDAGVHELQRCVALQANGSLPSHVVQGSVRWAQTVSDVRAAISRAGWGGVVDGSQALAVGARQIEALTRAGQSLDHAVATLDSGLPLDLVTTDMRDALAAFGEVTGDSVTEDVLDGIFSRFCVGK